MKYRVWLFAIVLGRSSDRWAQHVLHQDLGTVLHCHMLALEHLVSTLHEILYDRMKTAVLGEAADHTGIVYSAKPIGFGVHYGFRAQSMQGLSPSTASAVVSRKMSCLLRISS